MAKLCTTSNIYKINYRNEYLKSYTVLTYILHIYLKIQRDYHHGLSKIIRFAYIFS